MQTQLIYGVEGTYATRQTPSRALEFASESLKAQQEHLASAGLRTDAWVPLKKTRKLGKKDGSGSVVHEIADRGMVFLFDQMFGNAAKTQPSVGPDPTVYQYTSTLVTLVGKSLSCQVGREALDGLMHPYDYMGLKVASWKISGETGKFATLELAFDIADFANEHFGGPGGVGYALVTPPVYPAAYEPLIVVDASVTFDISDQYPFTSFTLSGDNGLRTDAYHGSGVKSEPIIDKQRAVTLEVAGDYIDERVQKRLDSGETCAVVIKLEGSTISHAYKYGLEVTIPAMATEGDQPNVGGYGRLDQAVNMVLVDNETDEPITSVFTTTDSAA